MDLVLNQLLILVWGFSATVIDPIKFLALSVAFASRREWTWWEKYRWTVWRATGDQELWWRRKDPQGLDQTEMSKSKGEHLEAEMDGRSWLHQKPRVEQSLLFQNPCHSRVYFWMCWQNWEIYRSGHQKGACRGDWPVLVKHRRGNQTHEESFSWVSNA